MPYQFVWLLLSYCHIHFLLFLGVSLVKHLSTNISVLFHYFPNRLFSLSHYAYELSLELDISRSHQKKKNSAERNSDHTITRNRRIQITRKVGKNRSEFKCDIRYASPVKKYGNPNVTDRKYLILDFHNLFLLWNSMIK